MSASALLEGKEKDVHVVAPETGDFNIGWAVLLVVGSAAVCHIVLAVFIALVNRALGR